MKIPANNQVFFIKNVVAVAAYRSCRLWRWVKMSWIHYVLYNHHWTQCRHALSNTSHVAQKTNSGTPRESSKTPLTGCQVEPPDSCTPIKLKALGPHALSHGRTNDQLECLQASSTVSTIHRLTWLLMISLKLQFQCMNIRGLSPPDSSSM